MNVTDLMQSFFGGDNAAQLGKAVGLDASTAQKALGVGLPMQLDALADHASNPQGQAQIADAIQNLPKFGSIGEALSGADGATNLQRAGELLGPALLGGKSDGILSAITSQVGGASSGGVQKLMNMALPLLLSVLGQKGGLNAGNIGSVLGGMKGGLGGLGGLLGAGAAVAGLGGAAGLGNATGLGGASHAVSAGGVPGMVGALTSGGLLDFVKGQFSGANADKIGAAAGFGGSASGRAAQAALPLVLNALVNKGKTEAGANDLLGLTKQFAGLTDAGGNLNASMLGDSAELGRVETQGRGLLGSLFGNVDEITGRLGTALGGSGSNASRLLALAAPLVLSMLGKKAGGMNASGLSGLLGGLGGSLAGLLPAGLGGLGALLGAGSVAAPAVAAPAAAPRPATPTTTHAATPPRPVTPPPPPVTTGVTTEKRGGFPWWLIPLLLLLGLGGCYLANQNRTATTATTEQAASILVTNPTSDANLPPAAFTMSGTGPAGTTLRIEDQGQEVATATVGADGNWSAEIPAPTVGEHTYSVIGGENVRSEFKVNVTDDTGAVSEEPVAEEPVAEEPAATGDGTFAISEPAADATLPAGGFTMSGTGNPGDTLQILEDGTSLGNVTVGEDGTWSLDVPSPTAGAHTYTVNGPDGTEVGTLAATIGEADANASAANCTDDYSLSITDGQTVSEPFRFGGKGQGDGYSVTVKRGDRQIGVKDIPLDATCGWSYQSKPGAGTITYEVRPLGDAAAEPLSTVNLTVGQ